MLCIRAFSRHGHDDDAASALNALVLEHKRQLCMQGIDQYSICGKVMSIGRQLTAPSWRETAAADVTTAGAISAMNSAVIRVIGPETPSAATA